MLREIFRSVPLPYYKVGDPEFGRDGIYGGNILPYAESLANVWGLHVSPQPLPNSPESIYVWSSMNTRAWPSFGFGFYRFNALSGVLIERIAQSIAGQSLFLSGGASTSRGGALWFKHIYLTDIVQISLGSKATTLIGDEPEVEDSWAYLPDTMVNISHFVGAPEGDPNNYGSAFAVDEKDDYFLNAHNLYLRVYKWTTGEHVWTFRGIASEVLAIALEDKGHAYVLQNNRVLWLLDYIRGEILGSVKIPPPVEAASHTINGRMAWDPIYRRILIMEETADTEAGASTTRIRGYRQVPEPVRLTTPIPLKAPRQRRTVPVLVQALGDLNEGVGGYVMDATVTGAASLVGFPVSDGLGNSILHVACEGSSSFSGEPDWSLTGSPDDDPPHTGLVHIAVTARVYGPPLSEIPISGVSQPGVGGEPGGSGPGSGQERFIWAWDVRGSITPDAPGSPGGAPVTMEDWKAYFFEIADRVEGTPANDYQAVLLSLRDQGMHVNPTPGEVPQESWAFYGMSVMIDGGGVPRGRIWLPTATPDSLGYYTNEIQVIADDPDPGTGETAPNMFSILESVYNSQTWRLDEAYEDELDGRGAFTEAAVTAMHDQDARFGHIQKNPGQNQYNGHAVDALVFKNDDGTTGEIFDIVTGSGDLCWRFVDRSEGNLEKWYYPA